jgi:hypothetical protein
MLLVQENDRILARPLIVTLGACHNDVAFLIGTTMCATPDVLNGRHVLPYTIFTKTRRPCMFAAITTPMILLLGKFF